MSAIFDDNKAATNSAAHVATPATKATMLDPNTTLCTTEMERTHIRENLRNCYRDLVRWNALYAAGINGLYHIAIGSTAHDCAIHIDDR